MDFRTTPSSFAGAFADGEVSNVEAENPLHIIDQMIIERATTLSRHFLWPAVRPLLYRFLRYRQAVAMADNIAPLSGMDAMGHISTILSLDVSVNGTEKLPRSGGFILAPTHPTGIADGIAVFDMLKGVRPDMAIFANRDAIRAAAGFRDLIIPVEWRGAEKSHAKSRDTLEMTARAFLSGKAVVLFPSGRIAFWNEGHLTERLWQSSVVSLARRYGFPVVPARITARNSGLFYFLSRYSTELRDMTIFHELLNKKGRAFTITIGKSIPAAALDGDVNEVARRLQIHAVERLAVDPDAVFVPL